MGKLGIIGFGAVGKSVLAFVRSHVSAQRHVTIWDQRDLMLDEQALIARHHAVWMQNEPLKNFLEQNDVIILSPGVDVREYYSRFSEKISTELDLFSHAFKKPSIAVTGTLGKTTVTRLLSFLLSGTNRAVGNIGRPMLDLVHEQNSLDRAVLELSSFQLEHNSTYAPDIALITNICPNHLDRHDSFEDYVAAKCQIFAHQKENQIVLLPLEVLEGPCGDLVRDRLCASRAQRAFICLEGIPTREQLFNQVLEGAQLFYKQANQLYVARVCSGRLVDETALCDFDMLPKGTFGDNWLSVCAMLHVTGQDVIERLASADFSQFTFDAHRVEHVATCNGVAFYNDSKATVVHATQAAVRQLSTYNFPITLVVGGLSKGVDRTPLVRFISQQKNIKQVLCLGQGAPEFSCYPLYATLDLLMDAVMQTVGPGEIVLFSPGGASFDLFKNYQERGDRFKQIVLSYNNLVS